MIFKRDLVLGGLNGSIAAFIVSNLTAILFNRIINNTDLCNKPSFIYAFTYVLIEAGLRTNTGFYSWQLSQLFILAALWPLLKIYNQRQVIDLGFEVGLIMAAACFLFEPAIIFFAMVPVFLQVFRPFNWREWLFPFIGFALVFSFYACYRLLTNAPFFTFFIIQKFDFKAYYSSQAPTLIACAAVVFLGMISYLKGAQRVVMHARKQRQVVLFMFIITTTLLTLLNYNGSIYSPYFIVAGIGALFAGYYFGNNRFKAITELVFVGFIVLQLVRFNI
ncbi:MAG TPA: DUF6427 family protein [Flavobacteriales bacterium]|nr:DUF6427 family protein [Flavobacteriales bacterium]